MKKSFNKMLAASAIITQMLASTLYAADDSTFERMTEKAKEKIKSTSISASARLTVLSFDIDDAFRAKTGIQYRYYLDNDLGKYIREDRWSDFIEASLSPGIVAANRKLRRDISFGRFYDDWNVALKSFLFSPLDLKKLDADKIKEKMLAGDMAAVTLEKATFLGLRGTATQGVATLNATAGKVFVGKITLKMLKRADNKVTITFANADENALQIAANVKIEVIPGLLNLKFLSIDEQFRLRGKADLATYTYDLDNPRSVEVLNDLLSTIDDPTILQNEEILKETISLSTKLKRGILDVTQSELASVDVTSGITKEQKVVNNIVGGRRERIQFKLIPSFLESSHANAQSINLVDINLSGTFIKPGQYIVGYRAVDEKSKEFGKSSKISNVTSIVYQPDPVLQDSDKARGYRGLHDLVGISYHTNASQRQNVKEMITYSKLCNAGLINCPSPIQLRVVAEGSPEARDAKNKDAKINSNYFFSRGLFEKIKERMNWNGASRSERSAAIHQAIDPVLNEIILESEQKDDQIRRMGSFFHQILENDCYSNLIGLNAQQSNNLFKRLFVEKCGTNLYNISDEVVRLNIPTLLISMYDPTLLPPMNEPTRKATPEQRAELAKYFSVTLNTQYENADDVESTVNGSAYGMSLLEHTNPSAQVMEFTSLISTWQRQQNMNFDGFDRLKMIKERQ